MKFRLIIIIGIIITACHDQNEHIVIGELEKQLFEYRPTIPICNDTINSYRQFKEKTKSVSDTLSNFSVVYGFKYDYTNFYFTPNCKSNKNIVIPTFEIICDGCMLKRIRPILCVYLTKQDTIEFITKRESFLNDTIINTKDLISTKIKISHNEENIRKYLNEFYLDWYNNPYLTSSFPWIHLTINEDYPLNGNFLLILNNLIRSYYTNTLSIVKSKYNNSFCSLDSADIEKIKEEYAFRILVDDYDNRFRIE